MLEPVTPLPAAELESLRRLGGSLREAGYTEGAVSEALGVGPWSSPALDKAWWRRGNRATGLLGVLVDLLVRGARLPAREVQRALPADAWRAGLVREHKGDAWLDGIVLPLGPDLLWTDRAERSFEQGGLFLPDSSTLAMRRCMPSQRVGRHLDLGAGSGGVATAAARRAREVVVLDLEPRFAPAVQRTLALSGLPPAAGWLGSAAGELPAGRYDRVSFTLPLLVSWEGMAEVGPLHTIGGQPHLLLRTLEQLARVLAPGGLALLYTQDWADGASLPEAIAAAFGPRGWRGAFWWDTGGDYHGQRVRTGVLAIRADAAPGWADEYNEAPDRGISDWWPWLGHLLGELPAPG